jgi:hypothetical protein
MTDRSRRVLASVHDIRGPVLVALVIAHVSACALPVHFSQSPQILNYSQRYTLCREQKELRDRLLQEAFKISLAQAPGAKEVEKLLVRGSIFVRIASTPGDRLSFVIEGHGWHLLYYGQMYNRKTIDHDSFRYAIDPDSFRYLASADYQIMDEGPISLSDLRLGYLTLKARIINRTAFAESLRTVQGNTFIFLRIFIKEIAPGVYMVDRDREHDVGWHVDSNGSRYFVQIIGHLQFTGANDGRDLLDVRSLGFIATDYDELTAGTLAMPRRPIDAEVIEWLPARPCRESVASARS